MQSISLRYPDQNGDSGSIVIILMMIMAIAMSFYFYSMDNSANASRPTEYNNFKLIYEDLITNFASLASVPNAVARSVSLSPVAMTCLDGTGLDPGHVNYPFCSGSKPLPIPLARPDAATAADAMTGTDVGYDAFGHRCTISTTAKCIMQPMVNVMLHDCGAGVCKGDVTATNNVTNNAPNEIRFVRPWTYSNAAGEPIVYYFTLTKNPGVPAGVSAAVDAGT